MLIQLCHPERSRRIPWKGTFRLILFYSDDIITAMRYPSGRCFDLAYGFAQHDIFCNIPQKRSWQKSLHCFATKLSHFCNSTRQSKKADKGKNTPIGAKIAIRIKILTTKDYLSAFTTSAFSAHLARLAMPFLQASFVA